ncbi:Photosystem I reaction center subunit V, chloroplastic [Ananas comosus]|uniref:Photosystem I reaction center subunit V, chloroplastic n=1 Tax=Ananas comosus TaxID=4615 RepID=A0A199ULE8_ANACO|nr:Photosystem I reaction center subunit V, chloroplastic [Ananas comosus]
MATSSLFSASPSSISFHGLRRVPTSAAPRSHSLSLAKPGRPGSKGAGSVRAELNPALVISLSTGLSLFLGRFVFFNFQRENVAKQVPQQNGQTHFEAGDVRAKEFSASSNPTTPSASTSSTS